MKVAFISHAFSEYCIQHANELVRQGCDVLLVLPEEQTEPFVDTIDERIKYLPFSYPRYRQPIRQLNAMRKIVWAVRKFAPDVVHFQNGHLYFNFALPLLKKYPMVITVHDAVQHLGDKESGKTPQWVMDYGFRKATQTIIHGRTLTERLQELGFEQDQINYIPHISIGERPECCDNLDDDRTVLFFGRIWGYKGLDYLIQAEPKISAAYPDVKIVIAGKGDDMDQYRQQMVHPDRFEVLNDWISDEKRTELFARASVVALPYIEASQSGVVPIAYQHEKPVVATRIGGLPDVVSHGETGLLVEPKNSDELATAIIELLEDRPLRQKMGKAGKEKLAREASPPVVVSQSIRVYDKAIRTFNRSAKFFGNNKPKANNPLEWAGKRLHSFVQNHFNQDGVLVGADPGVRFNYRIWRFLKSIRPNKDWGDSVMFQQGNGYWIQACWAYSESDNCHFAKIAIAGSDRVVSLQKPNGSWEYPDNEWRGKVTTVEGVCASLGLLETYRHTNQPGYLEAVLKWNDFFLREIGFQDYGDLLAVNYFSNELDDLVPNNSALALRYFAELAQATGDEKHLVRCERLLNFVATAQLSNGEIPYVYKERTHFQCFQYQAFIFLDLYRYYQLTNSKIALETLRRQTDFLASGISQTGYAYYDCSKTGRTVNYHTAAVATALAVAGQLFERPELTTISNRAFHYLLSEQENDGSFAHSRRDIGPISDRRFYPRYLAMMSLHFAIASELQVVPQAVGDISHPESVSISNVSPVKPSPTHASSIS